MSASGQASMPSAASAKSALSKTKKMWDGMPSAGRYITVALIVAVVMIIAFFIYTSITGQEPKEAVENLLSGGPSSVGDNLRKLGNK